MPCKIFHLLLGGRKTYFRKEEKVQRAAFSRQKEVFLLYVFCRLFLLFLLALPSARAAPLNPLQLRREVDRGDAAEDARLSCGSGIRRPPQRSPRCPVGIKPLGADARRGPLTPSAGVTSMLLRNPRGHL